MTGEPVQSPRGVCVVVPSCGNRATIGEALRQALGVVRDVVVVDDGSRDGTADVLAGFPQVAVVRHEQTQGKGAALASGLARAAELGFRHAITMDADGQHLAADLPKFLAAIGEHPEALVVGVRDLAGAGAPRRSRLLRANSDFWVWVHTGRWVHDTQSGFRAYPLAGILALRLKTRRYDYEVEALVKGLWTGLPVVEVPVAVRYQTGSPSHFRPFRDFVWVTHLNGCLLWQRLLMPASLRRVYHLKSFHQGPKLPRILQVLRGAVFQECGSARRFAACLGVGVFFGILPIWGFQMAAATAVAHRLRLSKPLVVAASNISIPVMIPFILWLSLVVGRFAFTGHLDVTLSQQSLTLATVWRYVVEYVSGAVILATLAGLATAGVSYLLARAAGALWRRARAGGSADR